MKLLEKLNQLGIQLRVENENLKVKAPKGVLTDQITKEIKTEKSNLLILLSNYGSYSEIPKTLKQAYYPLTSSQKRLWTLSQFEGGNKAYNIPVVFELKGKLQKDKLEQAFQCIIARHNSLRTCFIEQEDEVVQKIIPEKAINFSIEVIDKVNEPTKLIQSFYEEEFDLSKAPLIKAKLLQKNKDDHLLLFGIHHIIGDGWSMEVFIKELTFVYNQLLQEKPIELPSLHIQYEDYVMWQQRDEAQSYLNKHETYWLTKLGGELPVLELPSYKSRPLVKSYNGDTLLYRFSKELSDSLNSFSEAHGVTLYMTLLAGINALFYRYTDSTDIILGTPIAGRTHSDLENQIGLYLNTLAIRTEFSPENCFKELINIQKTTLLECYEHQAYPFDELIDKLNLKRDTSRSALFDVMVVLQNQQSTNKNIDLDGLSIIPYQEELRKVSQFDITFSFTEDKNGIKLSLEYNTDIYDQEFTSRLVIHLESFLKQAVAKPDQKISLVDYLSASEKQQLLIDFNDTQVDYPKNKTVVDLFAEQVQKTPRSIALVYENKELTYQEVDIMSNAMANYLLEHHLILHEQLIGVQLERSEWLIVSLLAILKTGAAYVPIDPDYPEQRIEYIVKDSECELVIDKEFIKKFKLAKAKEQSPNVVVDPKQLAYVMYTSGSTGQPKGVVIEHRSVVNLLNWFTIKFSVSNKSQTIQLTDFIFDPSIEDIFGTLICGGTFHIIKKENVVDRDFLLNYIDDKNISILNYTPMFLNNLLKDRKLVSLKKVISGGEALSNLVKNNILSKGYKLYNNYGPTESTTDALCSKMDNSQVSLGFPIYNIQAYILSSENQIQPIGVIGELCISGDSLARGYWNRLELTKEKFIDHPFKDGERLYKTGDLARWLRDGNVEFIGRLDNQVKLRGYRIELGEIENVLLKDEAIEQTVVEIKTLKAEKYLVAFYTSNKKIANEELKQLLRGYLPEYMIPGYYFKLDEIPLTPSGKVNRKALPKLKDSDLSQKEYVAPRNKTELKLATIWQEVLGVEKVGVNDNFFELGGHSLKVTQLINKINKELTSTVKVKEVFNFPTIESLVKKIQSQNHIAIPQAPKQLNYSLTSTQKRLWVLSQFEGGNKAYNIPSVFELKGKLEKDKLEQAFQYIIARHNSLRTCFIEKEDGVVQKIVPNEEINFSIEVIDKVKVANKLIQSFYEEEFDLCKAPLIKAKLLEVDKDDHLLLFAIHHIIGDGWSMEVFIKELTVVYNQLLQEKPIELPALHIQYEDYVMWQQRDEAQSYLKKQETYWLAKLGRELPVLELPGFKSRPLVKSYNGDSLLYRFSKELSDSLNSFSKTEGVTLYMTLLAGINALLYRYTDSTDIILGTPIAGRTHPDLENQIGLYLNTLAIRTEFSSVNSFNDLVNIQKTILLECYEHQDYPFDQLIDKLNLRRDTSRSALFDVMVVLQNQQSSNENISLDGLSITPHQEESRKVSQFDMTFSFSEDEQGVKLLLEYNTDIYDHEFMYRLVSHLESFLKQALASPEEKISLIDYLSKREKNQLLIDFNDTQADYPKNKTVVDLFTEQVQKTPTCIAIVYEEKELTYRELDIMSNAMANYLLGHHIILPEQLIGVQLDRSEWLIISLLAILKTGAAYVPIDPSYPEQRIEYIVEDSQCQLIIDAEFIEKFKVSKSEENSPNVVIDPKQLAYVMYTSGSTGRPKGVMIEHKSITLFISNFLAQFKMNSISNVALTTNYTFDISVLELLGSLCIGKKMILFGDDVLYDPIKFIDYISNYEVDFLQLTPSRLQQIVQVNSSFPKCLRVILVGGEALPQALKDLVLSKNDHFTFINVYGPTETTIWSTFNYELKGHKTTIGKALNNEQIYILSDQYKLQPLGTIGELCISGKSLARGYLNRPELTKEKFIDHPFKEGKRLYKTGDLARWLSDGNIEFVGRKDNQVKLRGYRIELGEIESILLKHEAIRHAIVEVSTLQTEKYLVAYYTSSEKTTDEELRKFLRVYLAEYMIPNYFIQIDAIPLTSSGKIDRKSLLDMSVYNFTEREYVAPKNELEEKLVVLWEEVLGVERVGIKDNFFELGGHSLVAMHLTSKINKNYDTNIKINEIYKFSLLEDQAELILSKINHKDVSSKKTAEQKIISFNTWVLQSYEQEIIFNYQIKYPESTVYNSVLDIYLNDIVSPELIKKKISNLFLSIGSLNKVFEKHNYPMQKIDYPNENIPIDFQTIGSIKEIGQHLDDIKLKPFDLGERAIRIKAIYTNNSTIIFFVLHHILFDKRSLELVINVLKNKDIDSKGSNLNYLNYSTLQRSNSNLEKIKDNLKFWRNLLNDVKDGRVLSTENSTFSSSVEFKAFTLNGEKLRVLKIFLKSVKISFSTYFLTIFIENIIEFIDKDNFCIGIAVDGRVNSLFENTFGCFNNTIPLLVSNNEMKRKNNYKTIKNNLLSILQFQDTPLFEILQSLEMGEFECDNLLFDTLYNYINASEVSEKIDSNYIKGIKKRVRQNLNQNSRFKLALKVVEKSSEIEFLIRIKLDDVVKSREILTYFEKGLKNKIKQSILPI